MSKRSKEGRDCAKESRVTHGEGESDAREAGAEGGESGADCALGYWQLERVLTHLPQMGSSSSHYAQNQVS